jgi:hypothetical protein
MEARRVSRSAGLTSLMAMMRRSAVVAVWRLKPARVLGRAVRVVLVDGEEEESGGLIVEVGEIGAFEGGVGGKGGGVGEVEAEGETALEPGLDGVAVGGDDLWGGGAGEGGEVLV